MRSKRTSGNAYFLILKCEDGKSRKSWVDSGLINFKRWEPYLRTGVTLDNLKVNGDLIDADSYPKLVVEMTANPEPKTFTPEQTQEAEEKFYQNKLVDVEALPKERQWY